ncbi:MAG: hypothetical protein WA435_03505 [Gallionellaceae bacterium]
MNQIIINEVDELIAVGEKLCTDASTAQSDLGNDRIQELLSMTARGGQLITRLYGNNSQYFEMFQASTRIPAFSTMHSNYYSHVSKLVGLFKGIQHDINAGMLSNIRSLVQAEIFADFLDMAEHLLGEGYKDASAVLLGAVLEDSLRKIADANGVPTAGSKGQPLTLDPLNVALVKKEVYGPLVQKQITSWANLRNDAAHGHFTNYDAAQVKQMLFFVQKFCADFLK